jgi:hypothetical protein
MARTRLRRSVTLAGLSAIIGVTFAPATATVGDPSLADSKDRVILQDADGDGVLESLSTAGALAGAAEKEEPVEDLSQLTETLSVVANPDGSFTATDYAAAVRVKRGTEWIDVDPALQKQADGTYEPAAVPAQVRVGGGGTTEAARVSFDDGKSIAVTWPKKLPTPSVEGSVATYRLSSSTDLIVSVTGSGVATHLRLNSPPAKDDPVFTFGLTTENLTVSKARGGGLNVTDGSDDKVGSTSSLVAWDAQIDEAGDPKNVVPLSADLTNESTFGDRTTQDLKLTAPDDFLSDPKTVYPVIIDPDINAVNQLRDTFTRAGDTTPAGNLPYLMMGREGGSSNVNPSRAFVQWENTMLAGKTITAASMNFYQYFAGSCSAKDLNIHPLTAEFHETTTVDTNRPAVNTGTGASSILTASKGPNCTGGSGFVSASVLSLAKAWAKGPSAGGYQNWGVQLNVPSASGSDATFERRFCSEEPSTNTAIACSSSARVPFMKFTYTDPAPATPTLPTVAFNGSANAVSTTVSGVASSNVRGKFEVAQGATVVHTGYSAFVPTGSSASMTLPPLPDGAYTVRAWANDGAVSSTQSTATKAFDIEEGAAVEVDPTLPSMTSYGVDEFMLGDMQKLAAEEGTTVQQAVDRYGWQNEFADLAADVQATYPDLFSAAEINTTGTPGATIDLTSDASASESATVASMGAAADLPVPVTVDDNAKYNEPEELTVVSVAHDAVIEAAGTEDVSTFYDESADIVRAVVGGSSASESALETAVASSISQDLPPIAVPGVDVTVQSASATQSETLRGGAVIGGGSGGDCTSGWPVKVNGLEQYGLITAEHCADDHHLYAGRSVLNPTSSKLPSSKGDIEYHKSFGEGVGRSFYYAVGKTRAIQGIQKPVKGLALCLFGRNTKGSKSGRPTCSKVDKLNTSRGKYDGLVSTAAYVSNGGDSGGPWYSGGWAYGVHSGYHTRTLLKRSQFTPVWGNVSSMNLSIRKAN